MAINFGFKEEADTGMELSFLGSIKGTENIGKDGTILSFKERPETPFDINFTLKIAKDILSSTLPDGDIESNSFKNSIQMNLFYESVASRRRGLIKLIKDNKSSDSDFFMYTLKMSIDPALWFGDINFKAIALRTKECPAKEGFNTEKHSILGSSTEKRLYIDPFCPPSGGQLDVKIGEIDDYSGVLYKLDKENLVVLLNNKSPKLVQQILSCENKTGKKATLRDALFEPIVIDITEQLAREAFKLMLANEEDNHIISPSDLDEPYKSVASDIAKQLCSDSDSEDEMNQSLVDKLYDPDDRQEVINEALPMIVQSLSKVESLYNSITKVILETQERSND